MEPWEVLTFMIRGVSGDLERRDAKDLVIRTGPVTLVRQAVDICSVREPGMRATPALLIKASILEGGSVNWRELRGNENEGQGKNGRSLGKGMRAITYLPCLVSTVLAAAEIDSALETSTSRSSTLPGRLRDWRSFTAASPLETERLPRRTCFEGSARSCEANSKPMPPLPSHNCYLVLTHI